MPNDKPIDGREEFFKAEDFDFIEVKEYFKPEDFESPELIDFFQCYRHAPITNQELTTKSYELLKSVISDTANALLQAHLAKLPRVHGKEWANMNETMWTSSTELLIDCTNTALLWGVREIEK